MDNPVKLGFDDQTIDLRVEQLIPTKPITTAAKTSRKYKQIISSIEEVGIIEPPVVTKEKSGSDLYILLDGHLRIEALKEIGERVVTCLISKDDEAFTYNKHINRLSTVQEHKMIVRAVERGVPEEKIAQALSVDVASIIRKRTLLEGICPEATDLLKDKMVAIGVFNILRKMKPMRQMQVATLMNDANAYSLSYARALLASTPKEELVNPEKPKKVRGLTEEQMTRMENEMVNLEREYRLVEESYSTDVLNLTLAKGYLTKLLGNARVVRYLAQNHAEILSQFQKIADIKSVSKETEEAV
ncbi:MAG: ParB N-terminal domain-containing protein [Micavibrio sp.]|nr:ParB N-terminal domain-containing protein [Micavibrio sp.]